MRSCCVFPCCVGLCGGVVLKRFCSGLFASIGGLLRRTRGLGQECGLCGCGFEVMLTNFNSILINKSIFNLHNQIYSCTFVLWLIGSA